MKNKLSLIEITLFGVFGAIMFLSRQLLAALPNIHPLDLFIVSLTVVYRKKALYPIYVFVLLEGIFAGFSIWWIPYIYIWLFPWACIMLIPQKIPSAIKPVIYALVCSLHGFLYGVLYAPFQAVAFGLTLEGTLSWIVSGLSFDIIHGVSNLVAGTLVLPLVKVIQFCRNKL